MIPFHAGTITFCHSQTAAPAIASQAAFSAGHAVPVNHSTTAPAAVLMPDQTFAQISCPTSVWVKNHTSAVTSRPIAAMTQPITGIDLMPVEIERNTPLIDRPTAVRPPEAIHAAAPATPSETPSVMSHAWFWLIQPGSSASASTKSVSAGIPSFRNHSPTPFAPSRRPDQSMDWTTLPHSSTTSSTASRRSSRLPTIGSSSSRPKRFPSKLPLTMRSHSEPIDPPKSSSAGMPLSRNQEPRSARNGVRRPPTSVAVSFSFAVRRCATFDAVSCSRAKLPVASADCFCRRLMEMSCFSCVENDPPVFSIPIARPSAVSAASFRLMP